MDVAHARHLRATSSLAPRVRLLFLRTLRRIIFMNTDDISPLPRRVVLRWLAWGGSHVAAAMLFACKEPSTKADAKKAEKADVKKADAKETDAKKAEKATDPGAPKSSAPSPASEPAAPPPPPTTMTVKLEVGDSLQYSTRRIEVPAQSRVDLTIVHTGKLPKDAMGHNFVLLKPGTNKDTFATAALSAPQSEYIPPSMKSSVIAHTKIVGGGESDTISFAAPAPGEYIYLCTFPGHYTQMNGTLVVT